MHVMHQHVSWRHIHKLPVCVSHLLRLRKYDNCFYSSRSMSYSMFSCIGKGERACYLVNMRRSPGAELVAPKEPVKSGGTLALLLPKSVLVWVYAWYKTWEGRTVRSCLRMWGRLPEVGDRVSLAAGCGKNGITYCVVGQVIVAGRARDVVISTNWKQFVPWVRTLKEARRVYDDMDVGSGFVFMELSGVVSTKNIGFN